MAKVFTENELESIRAASRKTCSAMGLTEMIDSPYGMIVNPAHAACLQTQYQKGIDAGNQNKLSLWFNKANSFIQAQGGLSGIFQTAAQSYGQYKEGYEKGLSGGLTQDGNVNEFEQGQNENNTGNIGWWILIIVLLLVLIIFSIWYFNKKSSK
jgi:hypothetical protein